jgi:flagellar protein FlaI
MECNSNIDCSGKKKIIYFDCVDCGKQNESCLQQTLSALSAHDGVDEVHYRGKEYFSLLGGAQVQRLQALSNLRSSLIEDSIWLRAGDPEKQEFIRTLIEDELLKDPIKAQDMLSSVLAQYRSGRVSASKQYLHLLEELISHFSSMNLDGVRPHRQPSFISSILRPDVRENSRLIDTYRVGDSSIRIYDCGSGEFLYFIDPPELYLSPEEVGVLLALKEKVVHENTMEVFSPSDARNRFKKLAVDHFAEKDMVASLPEIFARYTAGYGLLEILFSDPHVSDIYVDSPSGSAPVYVDHSVYGVCDTNLFLLEDDLERISSKFRSIGGRPFDEANPVMDMELSDVGVRVAGMREPATFGGISYAFRKRRENPWTLPMFVYEGMLSPKAAALLSFLVSGQRSILVTGARGSGKTSLLCALMSEIRQNERIVLMEDTPEVPSKLFRDLGWRIEHLRNQAVVGRHHEGSYELSPEENLRAALRLGESVLVLGEVRGPEARALFEAMRVGAAGGAVLGTIHGSSAYDTWDRLTHDLNVPPSSFKAVDVVVSVGYREDRELSKKTRYVRSVTEVRKNWSSDPLKEGCLVDLVRFNDSTDSEDHAFENSDVLMEIAARKRMSRSECDDNIHLRERMIRKTVELARGGHKNLLEVHGVLESKKTYLRLINQQQTEEGKIDYRKLYRRWSNWIDEYATQNKAEKQIIG